MAGKIVLILGGARSGKSQFAETYVAAAGEKVAYIATAEARDAEMTARIAYHRKRRPPTWQTFEAPLHAEQAVRDAAKSCEAILFDCLTLYVTNLLLSSEAPKQEEARQKWILQAVEILLSQARQSQKTVVFVSNEVGMGIVPEYPLSREYRDLAGWVNQRVAQVADEVFWTIAGIPVELKQLQFALRSGGK